MTQQRYCLALNIAAWLFLCLSLLWFYMYWVTPMIIIAVLATGSAVLIGFAAAAMYGGKGYVLSHVCMAATTTASFVYWLLLLIDWDDFNTLYPMLISLLPCGFYFMGVFIPRRESNTPPFFYKAVLFFSIVLFLASCLPVGRYYDYDYYGLLTTFASLPMNLTYFALLAAVIGCLGYFLYYSGRLGKAGSAALVGTAAGLALIAVILCTVDYDAFMLIGGVLVLGLLTAGYYIAAFSKTGERMFAEPVPVQAAPAPQQSDDWMAQIEDLHKLREAGILTEEEFQQEKNKIMGGK